MTEPLVAGSPSASTPPSENSLHELSLGMRNRGPEGGWVRILRAEVPSAQLWLDASIVLLDESTLTLCLEHRLPTRACVLLVTSAAALRTPWIEAVRMGVEQIYELPLGAGALEGKINRADKVLVVVGTERLSGNL